MLYIFLTLGSLKHSLHSPLKEKQTQNTLPSGKIYISNAYLGVI